MSSSSSVDAEKPDAARAARSVDQLVDKLYAKVGHESALSLTDHLAAGRLLCRLRDRIVRGDRPSARASIKLLAAGTALHRRFAVGDCGGGADEGMVAGPADDEAQQQQQLDDSRELVRGTATRLFALFCAVEMERRMVAQLERGMQAVDVDGESRRAIAQIGMHSLWETIRDAPKRRKKPRQGAAAAAATDTSYDTEEADEPEEESPWALRATAAEVARHALRIGASCLDDESWKGLDGLMPLFFRHSALNMAVSLLMPDGDVDHFSLGTAAALRRLDEAQRQKKLLAIAQAGESEAGQSVTRDLVLSFLLPSSHVGVRRTLLLSRAASTRAGVDHPTIVARGHDVACAAAAVVPALALSL